MPDRLRSFKYDVLCLLIGSTLGALGGMGLFALLARLNPTFHVRWFEAFCIWAIYVLWQLRRIPADPNDKEVL